MTDRASAAAPAATAVVVPDPRDAGRAARTVRLRSGPILPTLLVLAAPNILMALVQAGVWGVEAALVGRFGTVALAGLALVFPGLMLMQMMSAGAMGGGVSAAVARALGAGDAARADRLAANALAIGLAAGLAFVVLLRLLDAAAFRLLGGEAAVLAAALDYAAVAYLAVLPVWLVNTCASVLRGTGDMRTPAVILVATAILQVTLALVLPFGLGPVPAMGPAGVAAAYLVAFSAAALVMIGWLMSGRSGVRLRLDPRLLRRDLLADILKVGAVACLSPVLTITTVVLLTALAGGLGARLELLLVPTVFGIGAAMTAMVGTAVGAGDLARAERVAWSGAAVAALVTGAGGLVGALWPDLWLGLFTGDAAVLATGRQYLERVGPCYWAFGLGLSLYFASQGAGRMAWPTAAGVARLLTAAGGGWLAVAVLDAGTAGLFLAIGLGLLVFAALIAGPIALGSWRHGR